MKRFIRIAVALTMVAGANPASAQQKQAATDAARQDSIVKQALTTYQQAQAIQQKVLKPDDQLFSYSYDGIGQSLLGLGRPEEARPMLEKALAIRGTDPEDLADTHYALARTLWQLGQQKAAALRYADQAMREYQRAGKAERAAGVQGWLASRH